MHLGVAFVSWHALVYTHWCTFRDGWAHWALLPTFDAKKFAVKSYWWAKTTCVTAA
jgi:hypothetical protein